MGNSYRKSLKEEENFKEFKEKLYKKECVKLRLRYNGELNEENKLFSFVYKKGIAHLSIIFDEKVSELFYFLIYRCFTFVMMVNVEWMITKQLKKMKLLF